MGKPCDTVKIIPNAELCRVFTESSSAGAEMDHTFLCFEDVYKEILKHCSKDTTIIDFGCAYMPQAFWFTNCKQYIGVDLPMGNDVRFKTANSSIYIMTGQKFLETICPALNFDEENVIAICSYVPDEELQEMVSKTFKYHHVQYCDKIISSNLPEERRIYPDKSLKDCYCLLENGEIIKSDYIDCAELGIVYFENVINTGHFVIHWWKDDSNGSGYNFWESMKEDKK